MAESYAQKARGPKLSVSVRIAKSAALAAQGMSMRQIAKELGVSAGTVSLDLKKHQQTPSGLLTEKDFQAGVVGMCSLLGILSFHPYYSERSTPGWPDLALCGRRGFILRELKTEVGKLTCEQERWGDWLRGAGVSWDVWRPADLASGRIQRELEAIR